jgi:cell wall-associated NlpC family hydrolase
MPVIRRFLSLTLILALFFGLTGCATSPQNGATPTGAKLVKQVKQLVGTPYRYGGNGPGSFDCSGLIQFVYSQIGIAIPRTTRGQLKRSRAVEPEDMRPGDLIFFRLSGRKISHVGMYIGGRKMIHAPSGHKSVSYARLDKGYWREHLAAVGRFY